MASTAAYTRTLHSLEAPDLLRRAEDVRALADHPGWVFVLEVIAAQEQHQLQRLLNETTKPEDVARLRGLLAGLSSARDAAESIVAHAEEREREANRALAQEQQHV